MKTKNAYTRTMEEVWKRGYGLEEGVKLKFETARDAYRVRMALYNAVREAKKGGGGDWELTEAAQNCMIETAPEMDKEGKLWVCLTIARSNRHKDVERITEQLGLEEKGTEMEEVMRRLMKTQEEANADSKR